MRAGSRPLAALALAGAVALAGCSVSNGSAPEGPTDLEPFLTQDVRWDDCPDSDDFLDAFPAVAQCGTVEVPVDYFDSGSRRGSIDIAVVRIPAETPSAGSLLVNPGGPGASGVDHVAANAQALRSALPGYDIVGFDPRGVGRSAGFDCKQGTQTRRALIELDFTPEDAEEFDATFATTAAYDEACRDANPIWGFLGTSSVARDAYVLSRALEDDGINFYGVSYGSVIGYELLRTYPDAVDRLIIESPVDPAVAEVLAEQLAAFNTKIEELLQLCATPDYLYCGAGRSAEQVREEFIAALRDIENPEYRSISRGGPSESLVYYGMILPLYFEWSQEYTKLYLDAVHALINNGDASSFERWGYLYQGYDPTSRQFFTTDDIQEVVLCLDESKRPENTDIAEERRRDQAELVSIQKRAPLLHAVAFSEAYLDDDRAFEPCSYAQVAFADAGVPDPLPEPEPVANPGQVPVLVLGVSGDTATPYAWSSTVARALEAPLITQDTTGHGVYVDSGNSCTQAVVADYLASGALPPADVTC